MLYLRVNNAVPTKLAPTRIAIRCDYCGTTYHFLRNIGQSLGANCPDACPSCKKLFPTIDYLISETEFMEPTGIRARLHVGHLV